MSAIASGVKGGAFRACALRPTQGHLPIDGRGRQTGGHRRRGTRTQSVFAFQGALLSDAVGIRQRRVEDFDFGAAAALSVLLFLALLVIGGLYIVLIARAERSQA